MYSSNSPTNLFKGETLHSTQSGHELDAHSAKVNEVTDKASTLPPGLLERGVVTSGVEMTTRYTDEEWEGIIRGVALTVGDDVLAERKYEFEGEFTKTIDHTLLKLDAKGSQIDELCKEARVNGFATVCVRPNWVDQSVKNLKGTDIKVASVIGFHEGTYDLSHKIHETKLSLTSGALELDIVIDYPQLQAKFYSKIYNELASLRSQAPHPITLKLILETSQLSRSEIIAGCVLAGAANFDFVKTSTGFNGPGASVENVALMRRCAEIICEKGIDGKGGRLMGVKASGGIRSFDDASKMLAAGATRLGTSSGVWLAKESREHEEAGDGERPALGTRLYTEEAY